MGMKSIMSGLRQFLALLFLFTVFFTGSFTGFGISVSLAQEATETSAKSSAEDLVENLEAEVQAEAAILEKQRAEKLSSLASIVDSLQKVAIGIKKAQKELRSASAKGREMELNDRIRLLSAEHEALNENFGIIASEAEIQTGGVPGLGVDFNWGAELKELLAPLFQELKRLTSRPREIERLRSSIAHYRKRTGEIKVAIQNVEELQGLATDTPVVRRLAELEGDWQDRLSTAKTELSISQQKLQQFERERRTIGSSIRELFDLFFRSRGRNLVLAILASFTFWIVLRRTFSLMQKISPFHRGELSMKVRIFNVLYIAFTSFGGVFVFLLVLFFFGDWVLLTLALMIILGAVWSSKQAIPRYWAQGLVLLNMGQVREGERVIIDGVPWKVERLNYYTLLSNPRLGGATLRLPLQDMIDLRSRPSHEKELWFPSKLGDWVVLADETYGKIIQQTHHMVELVLLGGSRKTYQTEDFLSKTPLVLSKGFRHHVSFGIDYGLQSQSTSEIPKTLKSFMQKALIDRKYDKADFTLKVEFEEAGASSLNIAVIGDFKGDLASKHNELKRLMSRLCVDACNENGWNIPFEQLTVHMAANDSSN